jgi:hypothetical protein
MLRSDESAAYWTSGKGIAVFQVMSQGYGHDHRDKFGITLHGAGRLLYPDYNAVQYENPAVGWTRQSVAHNTLVVDEGETRNATPTGIRHDFRPAVKFLATSASGVFEGVDQTRALLLTPEYLLDLFHATSELPRTYDYLLHSLGTPRPTDPGRFRPSDALARRYWLIGDARAMTTDQAWSLDFVLDDRTAREKEAHDRRWLEERKKKLAPARHGGEWYGHTAAVRVTMAVDPDTLVSYGTDPHRVAALVARRAGRRDTLFAATHEPFSGGEPPRIRSVTVLARSQDAVLVRVAARDFTDYAAVAFGPQRGLPEHALVPQGPPARVAFRGYGYLRVHRDGRVAAWGGWTGLALAGVAGPLALNGQAAATRLADGRLVFGRFPAAADSPLPAKVESPVRIDPMPAVARVFARDRRPMQLRVANRLDRDVSGRIEFEPPSGLTVEPGRLPFGPLAPGQTVELPITVVAADPQAGRQSLRYRVHYSVAGSSTSITSAANELPVTVGPILEHIYRHPAPAAYRVHAPRYTAEFDMLHGLWRYLADDEGAVRLDGPPLFTFSDGERELLSEATDHAFTWPRETPAGITAHVYDRVRYQLTFFGDRVVVTLDPDWTQPPRIEFTVPGRWHSPDGAPRWARLVSAADRTLAPGVHDLGPIAVAAAELAFPGARWHLCFEFLPARPVTFAGTGLRFSLDPRTRDRWTVGFCQPGALDTWRWRGR